MTIQGDPRPGGEWPHLFRVRSGEGAVLLMLHGTGGDEHQIAALAEMVSPESDLLAPRGRLLENGMRRWFRRFAEGVFDPGSVIEEAAALASFIAHARERYDLGTRPIIGVGLSNGANIALATSLLHPEVLSQVVSFSGMHPLVDTPVADDLTGLDVLLLNGSDDPMAPAGSVDRLEEQLRLGGADVERIVRLGGHGIERSELDAAARWIGARQRRR